MVNVGKYTSLMDPMGIFFKTFFLFTEAKPRGICMFITFTLLSSKQAREEELYTYIFFPINVEIPGPKAQMSPV